MAKTQKTQTPEHELHTFTFTMDKTALFQDAMGTEWQKDNAEQELLKKVDRVIESLRRCADEIERERNRVGADEWPSTAGKAAEHAIHEVNWTLANLDEDGMTRQTREWAGACARAAAIAATIQMAGLTDEWAAMMEKYQASRA